MTTEALLYSGPSTESLLDAKDDASARSFRITITDAEIREALAEPLKTILNVILETLDQIPPELSADIFDRGIALCGGSVLLRNLDQRIREEASLPVQIVDQPLSAVVIGAGKIIADRALLKKLAA